MNCPDCHDLLQRWLDGEALPERTALNQHLAGCTECRERFAAARRLRAGLGALPRPEAPPQLAGRTVARVLADRRGRLRRRRLWAGVALAASVLLAVGVYFWLQPSPPGIKVVAKKDEPQPGPSLAQAVREAREAMAAIADRALLTTKEQAEALPSATAALQAAPQGAAPRISLVAEPMDSAMLSAREAGKGVSSGFQTVSGSTRRALNYFFTKMPPLQASQ
jgi:anti-sigma factor RsiW